MSISQSIGVGMIMFEGMIKSDIQVIVAQAKKSECADGTMQRTLSLSDERTGCMIIVKLNPAIKKMLKELVDE